MSDRYPQLHIESAAELRAWLEANHAAAPGIWLVTFKKASGRPHVTYNEIVEEAVAFGWIDSQSRRLDDTRSQLLLTPRKPASKWSRSNKARVERLTATGRMAPAGRAVVEAAKASGTWSALDEVEQLLEPPDLATALDGHPSARSNWDAFPRSTRRAILEWIAAAKRPQTRARRIEETASQAADNVRANQWRPPERTDAS